MHALGATRQDDGRRVLGRDLFGCDGVWNDFGVHLVLTYATSNELCVLRTEVNNQDSAASSHLIDRSPPNQKPENRPLIQKVNCDSGVI